MFSMHAKNPFVARAEEDHRQLHCSIGELNAALDRISSAGPTGKDREELLQCLETLLIRLEAHFKSEEAGGYLEEAVCKLPRLGPQVSALERQHHPLLDQLRGIVERARKDGSAKTWQRVALDFEKFAEAVMSHETEENRLLEQAFSQEMEQ